MAAKKKATKKTVAKKKTAKKAVKKKSVKKKVAKEAPVKKNAAPKKAARQKKRANVSKPAVAKTNNTAKMGRGRIITGSVVNLFFPGIGTLILGYTMAGIAQILIAILAYFLAVELFYWTVLAIVWIWALVISIHAIKEH